MEISVDLLEGKCKFHIKTTSEGETYMGTFTCKGSLSALDSIKVDKKYRELMGDNLKQASEHVAQLAFMLSHLNFRLLEFPDWWKDDEMNGGHLSDDLVAEVFNYAVEAEIQYREKRKEQTDSYKKQIEQGLKNGDIG